MDVDAHSLLPVHRHELDNVLFLLQYLQERFSSFFIRRTVADKALGFLRGYAFGLHEEAFVFLGCPVGHHDEAWQRHWGEGWSHCRVRLVWWKGCGLIEQVVRSKYSYYISLALTLLPLIPRSCQLVTSSRQAQCNLSKQLTVGHRRPISTPRVFSKPYKLTAKTTFIVVWPP